MEECNGIKLPTTTGETLGKFESMSIPNLIHFVSQPPKGDLYCTCPGFGYHGHCWHCDFIKEVGTERITIPLVISRKMLDGR